MSSIKKVAIVGAGGRVGGAIAEELLKTGKHDVTALTRAGSTTKLPSGATVARVDYADEAALSAALRGQQFLIISLSISTPADTHTKLVAAAAHAGVKYVMPNYYGYDPANTTLHAESLYDAATVREVEATEGVSYVAMACGFWYEWSLAFGMECFGIDMVARKAKFFDDGTTRINVSTWKQCGRAAAALLSLPEQGESPVLKDWEKKPLFLSSFRLSQRDMLDSVQRVTGSSDADWQIDYVPSVERWNKARLELQGGDKSAFHRIMYTRCFFQNGDGDFESSHGLCNEALGLPKEDLDEATKRAVAMVDSGWNPFA